MFNFLFTNLKKQEKNDEFVSHRRFPRRERDTCIAVINDTPYPIENWSFGGALVYASGKMFSLEDQIPITLKFKLQNEILDVSVMGKIVRKTKNKIALQFLPLTQDTLKKLQIVMQLQR